MRYAMAALLAAGLAAAGCPRKPSDEKPSGDKPSSAPASAPDQTPLDVARDYVRLLQAGNGPEAVSRYWDWDRVLTVAFGDRLRDGSQADREEMKRLLAGHMSRSTTRPGVRQEMAKAVFEGFAQVPEPDGTVRVNYTVRLDGKAVTNSMILKNLDGRWRVVDMVLGGMFTSVAHRHRYAQALQKGPLSPLEWFRKDLSPR